MKRNILAFLGAVILGVGVLNLGGVTTGVAMAAGGCEGALLGMRSWYNGLDCKADGTLSESNFTESGMSKTIGIIASNVLFDIFYAVGVLAVVFIIYSGFLMITSAGDVGKVEKAKKNIVTAITGLVIAILATTIVSVVKIVFW